MGQVAMSLITTDRASCPSLITCIYRRRSSSLLSSHMLELSWPGECKGGSMLMLASCSL
jgi:hypothetical protein